jgi:hypothetical protein
MVNFVEHDLKPGSFEDPRDSFMKIFPNDKVRFKSSH